MCVCVCVCVYVCLPVKYVNDLIKHISTNFRFFIYLFIFIYSTFIFQPAFLVEK